MTTRPHSRYTSVICVSEDNCFGPFALLGHSNAEGRQRVYFSEIPEEFHGPSRAVADEDETIRKIEELRAAARKQWY